MNQVRAAVVERPGKISTQHFAMPEVEPGAVLMRVRFSGVCGTDKHTFRGENKQYAGTPNERDVTYPLICGHENVGTVAETGGDVFDSEGRKLRVGDRIVPAANVACGRCHFCRNGMPYYMCSAMEDYGNSLHCGRAPHLFGGWSQYMYLLPGTPIFRVPDDLPDDVAVLTEIMAVTHGVEAALGLLSHFGGAQYGISVAILGVGPLGLCHVIKSRLLGSGKMLATDLFPSRLEIAGAFGADMLLDASRTDAAERIARAREWTSGIGPDLVLDCSGHPDTFVEAVRMVRVGGVVVESGAFVDMGPVSINPNSDICTKNVSVIGIGGETATAYLPSMRLMAANLDRLPFDRVVSHRLPIDRAQEAVELAQTDAAMKVVIAPDM